jgi:heptaprenyl diphosphate synthase
MLTPPRGKEERRTLALLGSLCLFLSAIEYLIPKPLPFMRIGLANLPLLLALDIFGPKEFFLLALLKVLGQGIMGGTLFSWVFLFSFAGTFTSAALMYLLRKALGKKRIGFAGLGCAGAMASNGVQLVLARYLIFGPALRYLAPPFLASGFVTGIALGLVCEYFCRHSRWYAQYTVGSGECCPDDKIASMLSLNTTNNNPTPHSPLPTPLFCAGLLMAVIFLLSPLPARAVQFLFFCVLVRLMGKKVNPFITLAIMAGIVFFNLLAPYGKVLATFGPLRITQGSLLAGLEKAVTLEGLLMLSRACIRSDLRLPGTIGSLLGESLRILEFMRGKKGLIRRGHIIDGIDQMMEEAVNAAEPSDAPQPVPPQSAKNILLLSAMVLLTAAVSVFFAVM